MKVGILAFALLIFSSISITQDACTTPHYLAAGLFIASIEEGGRIFTPVRLLPFDHAEALNHEFPTVLQLHKGEEEALLILGERVGFKLGPTLQRYPTQPDTLWPYAPFAPPPVEQIRTAIFTTMPDSLSPLPGLRGVTFMGREPVSFIVDTRGLSMEERGMQRATAMGLDITRAGFLEALDSAATFVSKDGAAILVFE